MSEEIKLWTYDEAIQKLGTNKDAVNWVNVNQGFNQEAKRIYDTYLHIQRDPMDLSARGLLAKFIQQLFIDKPWESQEYKDILAGSQVISQLTFSNLVDLIEDKLVSLKNHIESTKNQTDVNVLSIITKQRADAEVINKGLEILKSAEVYKIQKKLEEQAIANG